MLWTRQAPTKYVRYTHGKFLDFELGHSYYMWKIRTTKNTCPLCGRDIIWACHGKTGYAYCSKGPKATHEFTKDNMNMRFCLWEGKCQRRKNGDIEFIYEIEDLEKIRK